MPRRYIIVVSALCVLTLLVACGKNKPAATATPTPAEPVDELVVWLQENAILLDTAQPGSGFDDLEPLKDVIGDARIVALGEATHGTREFFLMKHRLLEFLVQEMGFNVFAIEANWPESNLVNDYVQSGAGDPAQRLRGIYFWTWNTQEVLDMILWMRSHNENPGDAPQVSFVGFDAQYAHVAMDNVLEYLEQVDPASVEQASASYACLDGYQFKMYEYSELPVSDQAACREGLQAVYDLVQASQGDSEARAQALQNARVVLQVEDISGDGGYAARDRYMADNLAWLLEQAGPDAKIVLWAHNDHIALTNATGDKAMGGYLHEMYGDEMLVVGFTFYQGAFNAFNMSGSGSPGAITEFQIALPPEGSHEQRLNGAELPLFFLDLRQVEANSPAADWFLEPHHLRHIGAGYDQTIPKSFFEWGILPQAYDALIYFQETSPSQLLTWQATPAGPPPVQPAHFGPENLDFEHDLSGWLLSGSRSQDYVVGSDDGAAYIHFVQEEKNGPAPGQRSFGMLTQTVWDVNKYRGQRLRVSARVKTQDVAERAGLSLQAVNAMEHFVFDDMQDRPILGDTNWTVYEIVLDIPQDTVVIIFGVSLSGAGQVWVDDWQFEVVDQDVPTTR